MLTTIRLPRLSTMLSGNPRAWMKRTGWLAMILASVWIGFEIIRVLLGNNLHAIIPGKYYRSAQLSDHYLQKTIHDYQIRTVVNLRGCSLTQDWYHTEAKGTYLTLTSQEDITLSAYRYPARNEILRLIEVIEKSQKPMLFHCRRGSDRTGLAAAIAVILDGETDLDRALSQLSLRYGHVGVHKAAVLDEFFEQYRHWLKTHSKTHSATAFKRWVATDYSPGPGLSELTLLETKRKFRRDEPIRLTLRATNRSNETWVLKPGSFAGIHAQTRFVNSAGAIVYFDRIGQFNAQVAPGESIDLVVAAPPLKQPGEYALIIDMALNQAISFMQLGSEPLIETLIVE